MNKIGPTEGNSGFWFYLEVLSILFDFDKVIGSIIDVKWIFYLLSIDVGKSEDVHVLDLLHIDSDVMEGLVISHIQVNSVTIHRSL
jgi:hypothetical protein